MFYCKFLNRTKWRHVPSVFLLFCDRAFHHQTDVATQKVKNRPNRQGIDRQILVGQAHMKDRPKCAVHRIYCTFLGQEIEKQRGS
jgi:hypothetical protein